MHQRILKPGTHSSTGALLCLLLRLNVNVARAGRKRRFQTTQAAQRLQVCAAVAMFAAHAPTLLNTQAFAVLSADHTTTLTWGMYGKH